ncbi:DUF4810 domain-containing protein [Vibrio breoganii]
MIKRTILIVISLILVGCQTSNNIYYWGDYSYANYVYSKDPSVSSEADYKEALEDIIEVSGEEGVRVAPGIHFELGYLYLKESNSLLGLEHLNKEKKLYPESTKVVDMLVKQLEMNNE